MIALGESSRKSTELGRRLLIGLGGTTALLVNLLWLGMPTPSHIYWTTELLVCGTMAWVAGISGLGAPALRQVTRPLHGRIVLRMIPAGVVLAAIAGFVFGDEVRPVLRGLGVFRPMDAALSVIGALCAIITAIWPKRGWRRWFRHWCERLGLIFRTAIIGPRYRD